MTQRILGHGEDCAILGGLRVQDLVGRQAALFEAGRIEIELRRGPEQLKAGRLRKPGCNARCKQRCRRIVVERRRSGGDFMEARAIDSLAGKAAVDCCNSEGQHRPLRGARAIECRAKRRKIALSPIGRGRDNILGHGNMTTQMFPLCSTLTPSWSSGWGDAYVHHGDRRSLARIMWR